MNRNTALTNLKVRKETTENVVNYVVIFKEPSGSADRRVCYIKELDLLSKNYKNVKFNKNLTASHFLRLHGERFRIEELKTKYFYLLENLYETKRRELELKDNNKLAILALKMVNEGYIEMLKKHEDDAETKILIDMVKQRLDELMKNHLINHLSTVEE